MARKKKTAEKTYVVAEAPTPVIAEEAAPYGGEPIDLDNPEFQALWSLIRETRQSVFLTGKAGTGKSTFLRYIISHTSKQLAVLAPTGLAAVNVRGQTIHSFFHLPLQPVLPDDPNFAPGALGKRLNISRKMIEVLRNLELIIIDEISMVRADVIDLIDKILRTFGGDRRKPFGGKQLLLVGDVFQLEPVVTQTDREILRHHYPHCFFFNADVFRDFGLTSIELRKVYRQKEGEFISILDRCRAGVPTSTDIAAINSRYGIFAEPETEEMCMTLTGTRSLADAINARHLEQLTTPETVFEGFINGDFPAQFFPTDLELHLKVGAQVILLRNDPMGRWVNGSLGIVTSTVDGKLTVRLENGQEHIIEPVLWENVEFGYEKKSKRVKANVKGSFTQLPVRAAWAITIHKSQGQTFERIVIDLGQSGAFSGGQVYVALSRCTSLEGIRLLRPVDIRDVYVNYEVERFARSFNDRHAQEEALQREKSDRLLAEALEAFENSRMCEAVEAFNSALTLNPRINTPALRRLIARKLQTAHK